MPDLGQILKVDCFSILCVDSALSHRREAAERLCCRHEKIPASFSCADLQASRPSSLLSLRSFNPQRVVKFNSCREQYVETIGQHLFSGWERPNSWRWDFTTLRHPTGCCRYRRDRALRLKVAKAWIIKRMWAEPTAAQSGLG